MACNAYDQILNLSASNADIASSVLTIENESCLKIITLVALDPVILIYITELVRC